MALVINTSEYVNSQWRLTDDLIKAFCQSLEEPKP
jgi:hypothetical protein